MPNSTNVVEEEAASEALATREANDEGASNADEPADAQTNEQVDHDFEFLSAVEPRCESPAAPPDDAHRPGLDDVAGGGADNRQDLARPPATVHEAIAVLLEEAKRRPVSGAIREFIGTLAETAGLLAWVPRGNHLASCKSLNWHIYEAYKRLAEKDPEAAYRWARHVAKLLGATIEERQAELDDVG